MSTEGFDKKLFCNNIEYLVQKSNMKIGEIEKNCNVNVGYISRLMKDESSKPSVEFLMNFARLMKISIESMLYINLNTLSGTETFFKNFLIKLLRDTEKEKLEWNIEFDENLNDMLGKNNKDCYHSIFIPVQKYVPSGCEYPDIIEVNGFESYYAGGEYEFDGETYSLKIKNATLILASLSSPIIDHQKFIEVWINEKYTNNRCLGCTAENKWQNVMIWNLYYAVAKYMLHPRYDNNIINSINAYMKDDLEDDDADLPF